ncbi:FBF1 factor, partial [Bombycilla garrulus]|nr:FBF1 factor [Bombycilla garrulus]
PSTIPVLAPVPQRSAQQQQEGQRALREARSVQAEQRERLQALQEQQEQLRHQEQRLHQANPPSPLTPAPPGTAALPTPLPLFSRQERRNLSRQREQLQQLRDELSPGAVPITDLGEAPALRGPIPVAPELLPPMGTLLGDSGDRLGSAVLYGHLLLLKHRARMDHDFLESERLFLQSLKKGP